MLRPLGAETTNLVGYFPYIYDDHDNEATALSTFINENKQQMTKVVIDIIVQTKMRPKEGTKIELQKELARFDCNLLVADYLQVNCRLLAGLFAVRDQ